MGEGTEGAEAVSRLEQRWNAEKGGGDEEKEFDLLVGSLARETLQELT